MKKKKAVKRITTFLKGWELNEGQLVRFPRNGHKTDMVTATVKVVENTRCLFRDKKKLGEVDPNAQYTVIALG